MYEFVRRQVNRRQAESSARSHERGHKMNNDWARQIQTVSWGGVVSSSAAMQRRGEGREGEASFCGLLDIVCSPSVMPYTFSFGLTVTQFYDS